MSEWLARALAEEEAFARSTPAKTAEMPKLPTWRHPDGSPMTLEEMTGRLAVDVPSHPEAFAWHQDDDERAAMAAEAGGVPAAYAEAFAQMQRGCPPGVDVGRWRIAVDDAGRLLDAWGSTAASLGWGAEDLFGLDSGNPMDRIDRMGLVWLLKNDTVTLMDATSARLSRGHTFRRVPGTSANSAKMPKV